MGYILDSVDITVPLYRQVELNNLKQPPSKNEAKAVLGKFSYVSRYIKNFRQITASLHPNLSKEYKITDHRKDDWRKLQLSIKKFSCYAPPSIR